MPFTVRPLSAAYIDYCHCLTRVSLPVSLSVSLLVCGPLSCTLLSFVMELLKNSVAMQEQVLACKGFLVIGYALEKVRQTQIGSAGEEIHERAILPYPVASHNEPSAVIRPLLIPLTPQTHSDRSTPTLNMRQTLFSLSCILEVTAGLCAC